MYKSGIPAEYLARQALRQRVSGHSTNIQIHEDKQGPWRQTGIGRGTIIPADEALENAVTDQKRNVA